MSEKTCQYCGAIYPSNFVNCFQYYTSISSISYSNSEYSRFNIYAVDAHALQHPELHGLKNNFYHLLSLCYAFEFKKEPLNTRDIKFLQQRVNSTNNIPFLEPPKNRGNLTINSIQNIQNSYEYRKIVKSWAFEVWQTWLQYHTLIRDEIKSLYNK